MPRRLIGIAFALALFALSSVYVRADPTPAPPSGNTGGQSGAGATPGDNGVTATATNNQADSGAPATTNSGGGTNPCTSVPLGDGSSQFNEEWQRWHTTDFTAFGVPLGVDPSTGSWWQVSCPPDPGAKVVWVGPGASAPTVNPILLAQQALATIQFPAPTMRMSPSASFGVVNFLTYLWIDPAAWQPFTATATAGPVTATVTATPDQVVWNMGDGHQAVCTGPGVPWNDTMPHTDCDYTYPRDSSKQPGGRYTVTARVYWHVTWTAAGTAGGGDLGDIGGATSTTLVRVDEIQTIVTG